MKKKVMRAKALTQNEAVAKEMIYKAMVELYEETQRKKESEEKEILLRKLKEVTKDKNIILSNYSPV